MKLFRDRTLTRGSLALSLILACAAFAAHADLPRWMQSVVSNSAIESALYRTMDLPGIRALYPRPPVEARHELDTLVTSKPETAQLYALRAHVEEQTLDFPAAEHDWQSFVSHAQNASNARFELAAFYHRRNLGVQEIAALEQAAAVPSPASEKFLAADKQRAWQAFPQALAVAHDQGLGDQAIIAIHKAWIDRYPAEPAVHATFIAALLNLRRYDEAQHEIDEYRVRFPQDHVLPIKAAALLALDQDTPDAIARALALFDKSYQPLWPADLIQTYFQLLNATHTSHTFFASTQAQLIKNPDDLIAATKIFDYYQQQGRIDAATNSLAQFAASKEERHAAWSADELYTFATLLDRTAQYPEAARYYFALASTPGQITAIPQSAEEAGLAGIIHLLLIAPEQPIDLGAGNLSIYRDLATIDHGPGYFNGILSLWLNSQSPASELSTEEEKATPYFHREKAAELLAVLDNRFPSSPERPMLHAALIRAYVTYGQDATVKQAGQQFLSDFPKAQERLDVALEVADADARTRDTTAEFALYNSLLTELSAPLQGMPLTAAGQASSPTTKPVAISEDEGQSGIPSSTPSPSTLLRQSLTLTVAPPPSIATAEAYRQILDRYIGRLTTTKQLPEALAVLRRELDRNPNDPLLYERLADFLQQNNLAAQQEEVYQRAIARFNDPGLYNKLARFYIRQRRQEDFSTLTHKVVGIFEGTELEQYFANVNHTWPEAYLQLNLYAHQRFPHDLAFTRNLLSAYLAKATADHAARERLLREHWQEAPDLQAEFFDLLSRSHRLSSELAALEAIVPSTTQQQQNPAATRELAEIQLWQSHFEQSAPLLSQLATQYPADLTIGEKAASIFRSLAYFDPSRIAQAVQITQRLSNADPTNLGRIATIGDIYADSTSTSLNLDASRQLQQASPFWRSMSSVHPGLAEGYLESATVFWDYFQFDDALAQIQSARKHFNDPALFAYQAGAIYEDKQDFPDAVAEYVAAAITSEASPQNSGSDASSRLLALAKRSQFTTLIDHATASAAAKHPTLAALQLRVEILNTLNHQTDIAALVEASIAHATTAEAIESLASFSQSHQLPTQYRSALLREITLSTDPVQQIQLKYQLAHAFEDEKDIPNAQRVIDSVYQINPKIVGVVRATTDFYWNNKQSQRAIATLVQASHEANPGLGHDYTLEAIAKSNESGDYAGARSLLAPLLAAEPFNAQYLNLQAESFSRAHDDAGVRDLYNATLTALKSAPLTSLEKRDKIALARQGFIPALTRLKDYSSAMEQHIALVSAFPEDDGTLQSAIAYARLHTREPQFIALLNQAVTDSPRDSRFTIDLARADVQFEDYAGALAAYSKAIAIRADRPDLYIARADLEEHQQAFDAVCADYDRLYLMTYHDPQWMEKVALARARQGKPDLAVKALQTAWIDGRPPSATNNFRVAQELEQWNLLPQAMAFAEQGVKLAGDDLLTTPQNNAGAILYARLLGRQRKAADAVAILMHLRQSSSASPSSPSIIVQQVEQKGLASVTDAEWRAHLVSIRRQQADSTFSAALQQLCSVVAEFYTPEEKSTFASVLDAQRANRPASEIVSLWIPAAKTAGLKDREASWRRDVLLQGSSLAASQLREFNTLEEARMDNLTRAETLDAYVQKLKPVQQPEVLAMAARAWRDAGDLQHETADLRKLVLAHQQQQFEQRLFDIYLGGDRTALLQLTAANSITADNAANFILANGPPSLAYQAVNNRASSHPAVWRNANTSLTGLYLGDTSSKIDSAFEAILANNTIGQRLQTKPDQNNQLIGNPWFYYGSRYGVWLTLPSTPSHDAEDYLSSQLEQSPSESSNYFTLAQTYLDAHNVDSAIAEYRHAIELDPADVSPNIAIAEALWSAGRHEEALTEWNEALKKLREMVDLHTVPESFWTNFAALSSDAASRHLGFKLKPGMNLVLDAYLRKNGNYRSSELLHAAFATVEKENPKDAVSWLLTLIGSSPVNAQQGMLSGLSYESWFPHQQLDVIYRRWIALIQDEIRGSPESYAIPQLTSLETSYLKWLIEANRFGEAQTLLESIPASRRQDKVLQTSAVILAAKQSRLPSLLNSFETDSSGAPSLEVLSAVANKLRLIKDDTNSRILLEYVFTHKLQQQTLTSPDYLALAEARINTNDLPGALDLLNRLALQGDLYENLDSASSLLVRTGHSAEALPLLEKLANGTPWRSDYRLRLGQAQLAIKQAAQASATLQLVASNDQSPYASRATAAESLSNSVGRKQFSSAELTLLANGSANQQQTSQPYFTYARISAALAAPPPQRAVILHETLRIAPDFMIDWLRFQLFLAESAQAHDEQANVAIAPVIAANPSLRSSGSSEPTESESDSPEPAIRQHTEYSITNTLTTPGDRFNFVLSLAAMDEYLTEHSTDNGSHLQDALQDLQTAARLASDPAQRSKLDARVKALNDRAALAQENAGRRPVLHNSLEQTNLVRPRLTVAAAKVP